MPKDIQISSFEPIAESLLIAQCSQQCGKSLAFSSCLPAEGKTKIVTELAQILSKKGRKVLVIDANPFTPLTEDIITPKSPTFFELLKDSSKAESVEPNKETGKWITLGVGEGGDLVSLAPQKLPELMPALEANFDHILFDLPAYNAARVTGILINQIKDTVLVVKHQGPSNLLIKETFDNITRDGGKIVGTIMNKYKNYIPKIIDSLI